MMAIFGHPETGPVRTGYMPVDMATALNAAFAISAALYRRRVTGAGQHLDVAMMDTAIVMQAPQVSNFLMYGALPELFGNRSPTRQPTANVFATADGFIQVVALKEPQVQKLFAVLGIEERYTDEAFHTADARVANTPAVNALLNSAFARAGTAAWEKKLVDAGVPVAEIRTFDAVVADPQFDGIHAPNRAASSSSERCRFGLCRRLTAQRRSTAAITRSTYGRSARRSWLFSCRHSRTPRTRRHIDEAGTATVTAVMPEADAPNPGNPIHSTDSAKEYGYRALSLAAQRSMGGVLRRFSTPPACNGSQPAGPTSRFAGQCFPTTCSRWASR
jgi:hypothetical protein